MTYILVFKIHPNDFHVNRSPTDQVTGMKVDWGEVPNDSLSLSTALNIQCKFNYFNLENIHQGYCNDEGISKYPEIQTYNSNLSINKFNPDMVDRISQCVKFNTIYIDQLEVMSRDTDFFIHDFPNTTYGIVLLNDDMEYYGHTYCWIHKGEVFSMGIRNRIDSVFMKNTEKYIENVSYYLLEGVRQFTLRNGFKTFNIVSPLLVMHTILKKLGFIVNIRIDNGFDIMYKTIGMAKVVLHPNDINKKFVEDIIYEQCD